MIGKTPPNKTHGLSRKPIYAVWMSMKMRCSNPRDKEYFRYGALGIRVCSRWMRFENFLADMGDMPPGHTIGRIHNSMGYSKANCRWETRTQQANNRRNSVFVEFQGERHTLAEWCKRLSLNYGRTYWRYRQGWPPERLLDPHDARL